MVQAGRMLNIEWEKVKGYWRDSKAQEFERHYITDLPAQITSATSAMEELENLIKKIRSDCE